MKHELVKLPYAADALEPVIGRQTIEFHHGKHLQNYVNTLNKLIEGTIYADMPVAKIMRLAEGALFNNAGQVLNHNLYFTQFSPNGGGEPSGKLAEAIRAEWGTFERFKEAFEAAGTSLFGSGWVWLAKDDAGKLSFRKEANGGNPAASGLTPLLGFDVWEHAYYLDYQNRRADHLAALWKIVDWQEVERRYM